MTDCPALPRSALVRRLLERPVPSPECENGSLVEEDVGASSSVSKCNNTNHQNNLGDFVGKRSRAYTANITASPLQALPPDASSYILSYLHPHDLFNFALISKCGNEMYNCELLWQRKFNARWNCVPDPIHVVHAPRVLGDASKKSNDGTIHDGAFWKQSYIHAHRNPHDLWIRHWNCVFPEDVTTCAGRTVVPDVNFSGNWEEWQQLQRKKNGQNIDHDNEYTVQLQKDFDSPSLRQCPTCRYHPMLHPEGYDDVSEAVDAEMRYAQNISSSSVGDVRGKENEVSSSFSDPVESAEVVAAAHAVLSNSPSSDIRASGVLETSTAARAIHYSTRYSIAKWCRNVASRENNDQGGCKNDSLLDRYHEVLQKRRGRDHEKYAKEQQSVRNKAEFAFECASTHERQIRTAQYQSSGMNFLTDALFFNIHPSCQKNRTSSSIWKSRLSGCVGTSQSSPIYHSHMDELLHDVQPKESLSQLGPNFENAHHTWHVIRLTNPDFILPITFRAYIQSDNFTIFPSEGYIKPGETTYLVLGVTMKGSLTNEVFEQFDIEQDDETHHVIEKGTHLPLVPFAIRYMFAPPIACVPHDYSSRPDNNVRPLFTPAHVQQSELVKFPPVVDHLWDNISSEADVRTIYVSAHVHSNYGFDEFQQATLTPFDVSVNRSLSCTTLMPNLQQKSPKLFSILENLEQELEDSVAGESYRSEKKCEFCKRDWGPQSELLGRAYVLRKLRCQKMILIHAQHKNDFERTLGMVPSLLRDSLLETNAIEEFSVPRINRICQLLFCLHTDYLLQKRSDRLLTMKERRLYSAYERYVDETYADLQKLLLRHQCRSGKEEGKEKEDMLQIHRRMIWRGNHNDSSVWRKKGVAPRNASCDDGFIGRQDDPNHEDESQLGKHPSMHTDMFQDDPLKAFVAAVSMISNPEYLHGVYDRVKKPGAIIRSSSLPVEVFLRSSQPDRDQQKLLGKVVDLLQEWRDNRLLKSSERGRHSLHQFYLKGINFEMNEQDPDGLVLITLGHDIQMNFHTSMAHYLTNVPFPGVGPLLFSSPKGKADEYDSSILTLYTKVQPYSHMLFPARSGEMCGCNEEQRMGPNELSITQHQQNQNGQQVFHLELNIVWLIARHLGWVVDDEYNRGSMLVDRRLIIATQWLSNTIMVFSLLASLLSRKFQLITSSPVDIRVGFWQDVYMNLPTSASSLQGYWSKEDCGVFAVIVSGLYFILGRSTERQIGRSYERELIESSQESNPGILQWLWDCSCPLFLQQRLYLSKNSRRTRSAVVHQVIHLRSKNSPTSSFHASNGRGRMVEVSNRELGVGCHIVGLAFFFLSFSACSPHFVVNTLTVFCCGLSYGMSLSLESMEIVRRTHSSGVLSMIKPRRINTLVMGFVLTGQLVGSSGGIFFLSEFVVTAICLLLGGAATVTSSALESWITFFCLSSTAFWGFVFARLGLLDGMRRKRRGVPSALLCASLCSAITMWMIVLTHADWYSLSPGDLIVASARGFYGDVMKRRVGPPPITVLPQSSLQ